MTLEEAIKQLTEWVEYPPGVVFSTELPAVKLGIEALKYRLQLEQEDSNVILEPLPGETED